MRDVAVDDLLREALDDRRLPHTGLADEDGVVLGPAAENLLDAFHLEMAADQRIELVFHGRFGQVPRELGQKRRLLHSREGGLFVQQRNDVLADGVEPHPFFHQDRRRDRALFAQDPEQQVLGADVVVQEAIGFLGGELQHALRLGAERDLDRRRDFFAEDRSPLDLFADAFEGKVRAGENPAGQPLAFPDQAEQQVLRLNRDAPELTGLISREEEDTSRPFRIAFEHPVLPIW